MRTIYTLLLALIFSSTGSRAQTPDQLWPVGTHEYPGVDGFGNYLLNFNNDSLEAIPADLKMNFETTVASMTDSSGQLLFYTNGCYIANALGDTMLNGADLNPGDIQNWVCPSSGYISPKGAMALPIPNADKQYLLLHMAVRYEENKRIEYGPFYYTQIDMNADGGKGAVVSKNNPLLTGNLEPFSAIRHGNGRDWWIVVPEYGTNQYHKFLLSPEGIVFSNMQPIGPEMDCRHVGSTAFAPDGSRFGRQQDCQFSVFDFDRCTGHLSNTISMDLPPNSFGVGGTAFSPAGDRFFITTQMAVMAIDLNNPNPQLDSAVISLDLLGSSLGQMQYTPNGQLFISNMARARNFHVIKNPSGSGTDIDFVFKGQKLPVWSVRTLPNFPNFQLLDLPDSPCDTLGITSTDVQSDQFEVDMYPNPTESQFLLRCTNCLDARIQIYDMRGILMYSNQTSSPNWQEEISVLHWPKGMYTTVITSDRAHTRVKRLFVH